MILCITIACIAFNFPASQKNLHFYGSQIAFLQHSLADKLKESQTQTQKIGTNYFQQQEGIKWLLKEIYLIEPQYSQYTYKMSRTKPLGDGSRFIKTPEIFTNFVHFVLAFFAFVLAVWQFLL